VEREEQRGCSVSNRHCAYAGYHDAACNEHRPDWALRQDHSAGRADGLRAALTAIDEAIEEYHGATRHALRELRRRILRDSEGTP
jgi:hypothetical protein